MSNQGFTKIRYRHLLSLQGEDVDHGELIVEGGIIKEVSSCPIEPFAGDLIDLSDCLVLPGFVNAHCHLALSVLHGKTSKTARFADWAEALVRRNAEVSRSERLRCLHAGAGDLVQSGVTTLADYLAQPELIAEYQSLPFRQVVFLEILQLKHSALAETLANTNKILEEYRPQRCLTMGLAPHAPYSVSPALFQSLRRVADSQNHPFSCHVAEFPEETRFLKDGGGELRELFQKLNAYDENWKPPGTSSMRYLDSLGVLDSMLAVHLNHIEDDVDLLRTRKMSAVFCPRSTRWFGRSPTMPVRRLLDLGIAVGIGTDSLASNDSLDFFKELRVAEEMLPEVSRREILDMATRGGARALGLRAGAIAPGMPADLIAFRASRPSSGCWADAVFDPQREKVDFVMIDGKTVLFESGRS